MRIGVLAARTCAVVLLGAVTIAVFGPLLGCNGACTLDLARWAGAGAPLLELSKADVNLNTWILAWVQHALAADPARLFDANVFHPAPRTLAGSEHMLAVAVLTAPVRALTSDATAVHNFAVALSFFVAGFATYALCAWLTGSHSVAAAAGVIAMLMPWRFHEIGHSQLLWIAWLPAVWLLAARCLTEGVHATRLAALAVVWSMLIFSSYYVAFYSCAVMAVYLLAIAVAARPPLVRVAGVTAALALPLAALAAFSSPYLEGRAHADIAQSRNAIASLPAALVRDALEPDRIFTPATTLPFDGRYSLPFLVLALALLALLRAGDHDEARTERADARRAVVIALWASCALALLMSFGQELVIGGARIPLPSAWAAQLLPGFEFLRAPMRWAIVIGTALPVAAAAGLHNLRTALRRRAGEPNASVVVAAAALLALLPLVPPTLPVKAAYPDESEGRAALYDALASLPDGPVLEVPWPRYPLSNAITSSRYMVASTRHWRPLLNGYTAYEPRSYDFLVRAGARLPERTAVERLSALTGVRWIVVHLDDLEEWERDPWLAAQVRAPLVPAYHDAHAIIYEVAGWEDGGAMRERLYSNAEFPTVLSGLRRLPVVVDDASGALSVSFPVVLNRYADGWANQNVRLRIRNDTAAPWAGMDPDPYGLVHVRYRILDEQGAQAVEGFAPLDDDVPANGALAADVLVGGELPAGRYALRFDLVQRAREQWQTLGIAAVEGPMTVADVVRR